MLTTYKPAFSERFCRWFYSLLLTVVVPVVLVSSRIKRKAALGGEQPSLRSRFGWIESGAQGGFWFHCVSVGEVVAASSVIERLLKSHPNQPVVVTTTTATGAARVGEIFADRVEHHYLPYDFSFAMLRFLSRLQPLMLVITEVELWPNLIHACWHKRVPVVVINARMTDRSARRYQKLALLFKPMLLKISHVCAQGKRDYENYLALGMAPSRLTLTNNIKFDQAAATGAGQQALPFMGLVKGQRPVLIGGSTHDPEEEVLINIYRRLYKEFPSLLLVLVPRHPQRFNSVNEMIRTSGFSYCRSSTDSVVEPEHHILLVDEMGKLNHAYSIANIAFVGGSLADKGGHNALEPAAFGLPILMGPHIYNNPEICAHLTQCKALCVVNHPDELQNIVRNWLARSDEARETGSNGLAVLKQNGGAVDATLSCIEQVMENTQISHSQ